MDRAHRIGQKKVGYENTGCGVSSLGNQNLMNSKKSEGLFDNFLRWNDSDPTKAGAIFTQYFFFEHDNEKVTRIFFSLIAGRLLKNCEIFILKI